MSEGSKLRRRRIALRREVLLVEIERRCRLCQTRSRTGLTKADARAYTGFACERCEAWNEDALAERDIPEWWEELKITSLDSLRASAPPVGEDEPGEVVRRMSDAWRLERGRRAVGDDGDESLDGEKTF
jgi:hypothetical protein